MKEKKKLRPKKDKKVKANFRNRKEMQDKASQQKAYYKSQCK